jgi:uridylate kinase
MKVISLTGNAFDTKQSFRDIASSINELDSYFVVTGGGNLKKYQEYVQSDNSTRDAVGIQATRLNAHILKRQLDIETPVPSSFKQIEKLKHKQKAVTGGITPGMSTDAVAGMIAEITGSDLYVATTVEGIFSSDPEENDNAEMIDEITINQLKSTLSSEQTPGNYSMIDDVCMNFIDRSNIPTKVFEATPSNIRSIDTCKGTKIRP